MTAAAVRHSFEVGDHFTYRGPDQDLWGEPGEVIGLTGDDWRCRVRFDRGFTLGYVDEHGLSREMPVAEPEHTADLDHHLAAALHMTDQPHADEVDFRVTHRAADGTPSSFVVVVWHDSDWWSASESTAVEALAAAMGKLRTALGGAS